MFSLRRLCLIPVALAACLPAVAGFCAAPAFAAGDGCLPKTIDLTHPEPDPPFTADQIADYKVGLKAKDVVGLRSTIFAYLRGTADDMSAKNLSTIPKSALAQPFDLYDDVAGELGGRFLTVSFRDHHSDMITAWIYELGSTGVWQVRNVDVKTCIGAERAYLLERYKAFAALGGA